MKTQPLRELMIKMLREEQAHASIGEALADLPEEMIGARHRNFPYSIWQLTEHIRITQWDIVEFSYNPDHMSPQWPKEYWPSSPAPERIHQWEETRKAIKKDRNKMISLLSDENNDLLKPFPYGDGQNLLREAILIIDHTSYHTGQIILLRKQLGVWG